MDAASGFVSGSQEDRDTPGIWSGGLFPGMARLQTEEPMTTTNYDPRPINPETVYLADDLAALTEKIAGSIHDVWARKRLDEGWTWGMERSDAKKTNPCLVPYENLPEQEKAYDRDIVTATIKLLLAMGYRIEHCR